MPWAKLDDRFWKNAKIRAASNDALALYTTAISYCSDQTTDGFVDETMTLALCVMRRIQNVEEIVAELVQLRLWEACEGGHQIHDFLEYNPSAAEVAAERAENALRQKEWRKAHPKLEPRNAVTNSVTNAPRNGAPDPVPGSRTRIPDPGSQPGPSPLASIPDPLSTMLFTQPDLHAESDDSAAGDVTPAKPQKKARKPKEPADPTFRARFLALATGCDHDPANLGEGEAPLLGKNTVRLAKYAPEQVALMCRNWPTHFGYPISSTQVVVNASRLLTPGPRAQGAAYKPSGRPTAGRPLGEEMDERRRQRLLEAFDGPPKPADDSAWAG